MKFLCTLYFLMNMDTKEFKKLTSVSVEAKSELHACQRCFEVFNCVGPESYNCRSMSVGDMIVVNENKYVYIESGFTQLLPQNI